MNSDSKVTRKIVERFHNAFEKHRPEDLDDLVGEGCVLENTAPAPDGARYEGREACLTFWKGVASSANLVFKAEEISAMGDRGIIRWQLCWSEREADRFSSGAVAFETLCRNVMSEKIRHRIAGGTRRRRPEAIRSCF